MGKVVLGVGSSHSPVISAPYEDFDTYAVRDSRHPAIPDFPGLVRANAERMVKELLPEVTRARYDEAQRSINRIRETLAEADLDAIVIVGDDQGEWFREDNMPAIAIYWNDSVENRPPPIETKNPHSYWGHYGDGVNREYPVDGQLAKELITGLTERGFDIHQIKTQPPHEPLGHAWGFFHQRLMAKDKIIPIVPVMLNTYFPPNQPTAKRCWDLGIAIRDIVESVPDARRIAVAGSGGLSHFVIDEALDHRLLAGLADADEAAVAALATAELQSGTSEGRNWIVAGAAASRLSLSWHTYAPYYRSPGGTGIGLAFAVWS